MSDQTPKPLTEAQKQIFESIPPLHPPVMSLDERIDLTQKFADLQSRLTAAETRVKELEEEVEKTNAFRSRLKAKNRIAMDMIAEYQAELDKLKGTK